MDLSNAKIPVQEGAFAILYRGTDISPQAEDDCDAWNKLGYKDEEFGNLYGFADSTILEDYWGFRPDYISN